jgi:hypothetical protein
MLAWLDARALQPCSPAARQPGRKLAAAVGGVLFGETGGPVRTGSPRVAPHAPARFNLHQAKISKKFPYGI